jgi:hypothetical protein
MSAQQEMSLPGNIVLRNCMEICDVRAVAPNMILHADGQYWCIKTNQELDEIMKDKNLINFIRAQRLSRLSHIERMQGMRTVKAIYS